MSDEKLKNEIEWMKQLAEQGRTAPVLGGSIGIWWGSLSFVMMLVHWGALTQRLPIAIESIGWWWLSYGVIGSIGTVFLSQKLREKSGANSLSNRVSGIAWMLAGIGIFTFAIGVVIGVFTFGAPYWLFNVILPVAFICYGIAHGVAGALTSSRVSSSTAAVSFVLALVLFPFLLGSTIYLIAAFAVLLIVVLPIIVRKSGWA